MFVRARGDNPTMLPLAEAVLANLKVPVAMRLRLMEILAVSDQICARISTRSTPSFAACSSLGWRASAPSPLARGDVRIWAAGAIYAVGKVNFLFDRSQDLHLTADELAERIGVAKSTMANKASLISKTLGLGIFEPDVTRVAMLEQHPMAWIVQAIGFLVDARALPQELQDEARRRG